MVKAISKYQEFVEDALKEFNLPAEPNQLYSPLTYFLAIGGKRMRPVLALMAAEMFSSDYKVGKHTALAVELFHNFSLIHDDIMDAAPLRRGHQTVHEKWNPNIAILSGDALLIEAYKQIAHHPAALLGQLLAVFNKTATEVCEGQQWDMDFENESHVEIKAYLKMIEFKTAVLLGCSLKMGAIVGGATIENSNDLYDFGVNLGIAFQIQDDILDVYADQNKFGKQVGGDIISNKKTYLLLRAMEDANEEQLARLSALLSESDKDIKVKGVKAIYKELDIRSKANRKMEEYHRLAMERLAHISIENSKKLPLELLAEYLLGREQ